MWDILQDDYARSEERVAGLSQYSYARLKLDELLTDAIDFACRLEDLHVINNRIAFISFEEENLHDKLLLLEQRAAILKKKGNTNEIEE